LSRATVVARTDPAIRLPSALKVSVTTTLGAG